MPPEPVIEDRARYRRIIRAAEEAFKKSGFRGVTMEQVAKEAAVSKVTVYAYFKNKDELFTAVAVRMAELMRRAIANELAAEALPLDERLTRALVAKHRLVFVNVTGSSHAEDLFSQTDKLAGDAFEQLDRDNFAALTAAISEDKMLAPSAVQLAGALYFGGSAVGKRSASVADLERDVAAFVTIHLAGARSLAAKGEKAE